MFSGFRALQEVFCFLRHLEMLGPKGPETSVNGRSGCNGCDVPICDTISKGLARYDTILTEMMADEFNFLGQPEIKNYKAEADTDLIPIPGQLEFYGRCRCGVLLSACFWALFVADLIVGMEELELHCRRRGRSNLRKIKIATISARMVGDRKISRTLKST